LTVLANMMSWQRRGGDVAWVNFNNLSNTHAQSAIETPRESVFLTACGVAMATIARSPAAWPVRIAGYAAKVDDEFQVQAAWDLDRRRLILYILNRTGEKRDVVFDLMDLGRTFGQATLSTSAGDSLRARNTPDDPNAVRRETHPPVSSPVRGEYRAFAGPWSFVEVILG
jgi:alpha-L-arabinofuranosidase